MKNNRLYIVMVGLPVRGKSVTAIKLRENLRHDSVKARVFNNGDLRRKMIPNNTSYAEFYDPQNRKGVALREKIALINVERAKTYLKRHGNVAILDATNVSLNRRKTIERLLNDHPILFIECINSDQEILNTSLQRKISLPEFAHLPQKESLASFYQRISYYETIYTPLQKEKSRVRLDSLHTKILEEEVGNEIPYYDQIRDFLVTDTVKNLYIIRHGETYFNLENRIGGNSDLTEKGKAQAMALAKYFAKKDIPLIFTSRKNRTVQTAEPIKALQTDCTIVPLAEFNEINSGLCEGMSYERIRQEMPQVYLARKQDKYNYVYPKGEGYVSMEERIERGIKKALYLSGPSANVMIIGHRAANRMILSHFLYRRREDVPYIYVPLDKFYNISATPNKRLFQQKRYE